MSTLEERREARRKRRQQEDEELEREKARSLSRVEVKKTVDARLAARRLERQQRRTQSQHSEDTPNHEDDLEKRRQERRRLRQGDTDRGGAEEEEQTSSRRNRRRGTEDENASEETSSFTSRRRNRGGDEEEETPKAPAPEPEETPAAAPEEDNSAAQAEEEERRRREEEEAAEERERQRQAADDERKKRQEEEKRQLEEKRQRGYTTPRKERQSRPKLRTPRGPLKTPRSARQQNTAGDLSARSITEENSTTEPLTPRYPVEDIRFKHPGDTSPNKQPLSDRSETRINDGNGHHKKVEDSNQKQLLAQQQMEREREIRRAELFSRIDVKSRIRALEAEKNGDIHIVMEVLEQSRMAEVEGNLHNETKQSPQNSNSPIQDSRVSPPHLKGPLQSVRSNSDTDWDDRLTDIVANNRAMLSHDDTMERFTDFELGSCSSYDDIFGPKPAKATASVVPANTKLELMSTDEFSPVFQSTENIHERSLCESSDATLQASPQMPRKNDPKSQQNQQVKSILKTKSFEESATETLPTRVKSRSTQRERDLRRSNSRTRTRQAVEGHSSSNSSSEYDEHFIPFTAERDDEVMVGEKRRSSVVEKRAEKTMKCQESVTGMPAQKVSRIESTSENDSLFSGDDVSRRNSVSLLTSTDNLSSRDSVSLLTSTDNLSVDSEEILDESKQEQMLVMPPDTFNSNFKSMDAFPHIVASPVVISPRTEILKAQDKEESDSDKSLEPISASGFFGVKSDIPFNAKKKKINARRSGGKISQMTSIWSKMPPTVLSPEKEKTPRNDPPRTISVIRASDTDKTTPREIKITVTDDSSGRHEAIDSRMTEIQNQLGGGDHVEAKAYTSSDRINRSPSPEEIVPRPRTPNSGRRKEQLDELFIKLNSKFHPKEEVSTECRSEDRYRSKTPMFLAPFDSSVEAMQRSQSQPILTSTDQLEYYDPSQSVMEYIADDAESKVSNEECGEEPMEHVEFYGECGDDQSVGNGKSSQSSRSSRKDSNIAQCSSGSNSPRLESSLSNWSNRSVVDVSSENECLNSDSPVEEFCEEEEEGDEEEDEESFPVINERLINADDARREFRNRKVSAFSVISDVTSCPNSNSLYNVEDLSGEEPPDENELLERRVQTVEWLREDVGYTEKLRDHSPNASTRSNADSASAISIDSLDEADDVDADYPHDDQYHYVTMSPRGQAMDMVDASQSDVAIVPGLCLDADNRAPDLDLKLPLHFLHESSQEEEEFREYPGHVNGANAEGLDSHGYGYGHDGDIYSSDDYDDEEYEEYGEEMEEGEIIMRNDVEYEEGMPVPTDVDVMTSMDELGQNILDYLSDDMAEEGEIEEWGEEEGAVEEWGDEDAEEVEKLSEEHVGEGQLRDVDDNREEEDFAKSVSLAQGHYMDFALDELQHQNFEKISLKGRLSSRSEPNGLDEDEGAGITDSARVREMFKEHHGHIDDKDIIHRDNIPEGHEIPDTDEFFLSFEQDEEHLRSVSDYHDEFSDDEEDHRPMPYDDEEEILEANFEVFTNNNEWANAAFDNQMVQQQIIHTHHENIGPYKKAKEYEREEDDRPMPYDDEEEILEANFEVFTSNNELVNSAFDNQMVQQQINHTHHENSGPYKKAKEYEPESDYDSDGSISPISRGLRKQLVDELKLFDPNRLRRTSNDYQDGMEGIPSSDANPPQDFVDIETLHKPQYVDTIQHRSSSTVNLNVAPPETEARVYQTTSHCDLRMSPQFNHLSPDDSSQHMHNADRSTSQVSSERKVLDLHNLSRRSSTGDEMPRSRSGSMSRERRKSIRSFWQQLDEEKKKKKDKEEDWMRRRGENKNKERRFLATPDSQNDGKNTHDDSKVQSKTRNTSENASDLNERANAAEYNIHTEAKSGNVFDAKPPVDTKTTKKPPPAVAPKPDKSRRRSTIQVTPDTISQARALISEKSRSVKQIAQFHESQNKALQNMASMHQATSMSKINHVPSQAVKTTQLEERTVMNSVAIKYSEAIVTASTEKSKVGIDLGVDMQSKSKKSNDIKQMLEKHFLEKDSSPRKGTSLPFEKEKRPSVEREREIVREQYVDRENGTCKEGNLELERVAKKDISRERVKENIGDHYVEKEREIEKQQYFERESKIDKRSWIEGTDGKQSSVTEVIKSPHADLLVPKSRGWGQAAQFPTEVMNKGEQSAPPHFGQMAPRFDNSQTKVPVFSQSIQLTAPTLEEIDHLAGMDESQNNEIVDVKVKQPEISDAAKGKSQAPRPKFNAKALTKNNEFVLPAFAKKIEIKQPAHVQTSTNSQLNTIPPPIVPNLNLSSSLVTTDSESTTSLDQISTTGPEISSSRELKSWVADYLKDRISDRHMRQNVDFDPVKMSSEVTSANSSFYGHMPMQGRHHERHGSISDGFSEPALSSRSSREAKLSVAERISKMQEKVEAAKETNKPPEKLNPTQSQKQFASLLQNRLIDVIAQETEDEEKEREREKKKKKRQTRPPPNSWAAERQRLFGKGQIKTKLENFNPDQTSTPSTLSRANTRPLIKVEATEAPNAEPKEDGDARDKSVQEATSHLENLSESLSKDDVVNMNKVRRADSRKYRRVTTSGVPFSDIREKFAVTDSSGSSTESFSLAKERTRPNSPWISAAGPSPLVLGVINKLASSENTDAENSNSGGDRSRKLGIPQIGESSRGRVLERVRRLSSGENSNSNSRSPSQNRLKNEFVSGAFDRNLVSELVRRVESSDESGTTSLSSSQSLQPGELAQRARLESNSTVSKVLQRFNTDSIASSNSSPSSSMDRRVDKHREPAMIHQRVQSTQSHSHGASGNTSASFANRRGSGNQVVTATRLSQALESMSSLQKDNNGSQQHMNKRLDKERRHTTQVDFQELRDKCNNRRQPKEDYSPPQSPALKAIYACSTRDASLNPDTSGDRFEMQVARSGTFQRQNPSNKTKPNESPNSHASGDSLPKESNERESSRKGSLFSEESNHLATPRGHTLHHSQAHVTAPNTESHRLVPKHNEGDEEDVFSPLVSARVPEALNLPSDLHPPPAFTFSATNYEDDMSHGELAESESSDTADFYPWRNEAKTKTDGPPVSRQKHHSRNLKPSHQELQHVVHSQSNQHSHSQHSSSSNFTLNASLSAIQSSSSSSVHARPVLPETIIDARTATGHVRCRILSETPLEPDESGIGGSDNSLGSSTISVSSVIQDRGVDAPHRNTPPAIVLKEPTTNASSFTASRIPDDEDSIPNLPLSLRKLSLGNEASPLRSEMQNLLSPRRASIANVDPSMAGFQQGFSSATTDTHSSNASLSPDSCKAGSGTNAKLSLSKHDQRRRKSKSKFMQGVMEKKRNASEPNAGGAEGNSGSGRRPISSASDVPVSPNGLGVFGPKVDRKKSVGHHDDNTMKGYSKRFDALWAKFDPDQADETHAAVEQEEREEAERQERERMEAEEAARQKAEEEEKKKKKGKRKGLGGLTPEKKKLLKHALVHKFLEVRTAAKNPCELSQETLLGACDALVPSDEEKLDNMTEAELEQLVKSLHAKVSTLEEEVYDWEIKIRKQDFEINELTLKVNDTKGKFIKPVLRKVNKTESKLKKIQQIKESTDFRGNLKSTGQNKYALEEDEPDKGIHWRDELKSKDKQEGDEDAPADASADAPAETQVES